MVERVGEDRARHTFMDSVKTGFKFGVVAAGVTAGASALSGPLSIPLTAGVGVGVFAVTTIFTEVAYRTRELSAATIEKTKGKLQEIDK